MKDNIKTLAGKSARADTAIEAMQFAQAALSLSHAEATYKDTDKRK